MGSRTLPGRASTFTRGYPQHQRQELLGPRNLRQTKQALTTGGRQQPFNGAPPVASCPRAPAASSSQNASLWMVCESSQCPLGIQLQGVGVGGRDLDLMELCDPISSNN